MSEETKPIETTRPAKKKRSSALFQAMQEQDVALQSGTELQSSATPVQESDAVLHGVTPQDATTVQEGSTLQSGTAVQDREAVTHGVAPQNIVTPVQEGVTPQSGKKVQSVKAATEGKEVLDSETSEDEEALEKVTFYITLVQLEKLEDMVHEYKKRTRVRRANRNDIIRTLIDQSSVEDLFK